MSLAQSRSSRQLAPNSKQQALAKLASLKQGGLKRTEQFAVRARAHTPACLVSRARQRKRC